MIHTALSDLITHGEDSTVEFKRSLTKDIGRELCAFANASAGSLPCGTSVCWTGKTA